MRRHFTRPLAALAALALIALPASGGPKSVTFTPYGSTCAFFNQTATLRGSYDPPTCTLTLTLGRSTTCCNTFLTAQLFVFGAQPILPGVPVPGFVPGCLASVVPLVVLGQPAQAGGVLKAVLPSLPGPVTLYAQGINDYFTTIGLTHDFQTSDALRLDIL